VTEERVGRGGSLAREAAAGATAGEGFARLDGFWALTLYWSAHTGGGGPRLLQTCSTQASSASPGLVPNILLGGEGVAAPVWQM
jgi:hypothetical protein